MVMANNLVIGLGFLLGPVIMSRHFPEQKENFDKSREEVCNNLIRGTR